MPKVGIPSKSKPPPTARGAIDGILPTAEANQGDRYAKNELMN